MHLLDIISDRAQVDIHSDDFIVERCYSGDYADLSNDKEVEILKLMKDRPWKDVLSEKFEKKSPWLYKIIADMGRATFLDLIDIPENGLYLDVGSGWGQVCIPLGRYGKSIALDLTFNRLSILKTIATQENVPLYYAQGNFLSFPFKENIFDTIIFNGSLEWIGVGREQATSIKSVQITALKKANQLLKPDGILYIGIENSLGLKYIVGAPDDHTNLIDHTFLDEVAAQSNYSTHFPRTQLPAKTWSLSEYKEMIDHAGFDIVRIYGCFPDYKIIRQMIDLKKINNELLNGSLTLEHFGTNGEIVPFNEKLDHIYKLLATNQIAQNFCPSYGFIIRKRR
ncbi:class I SAM-dependent methyltransferase [Paenibacillus tyrfis]|uniref:class I SAM-dependent methyltransferase n=1 Tax=Paenibacillus tyrfis TaxID=1501230 RepID=UPI000B5904A8|nr:class I SAM-dependent methyltransferase [Paenibacillus tyrfis]